MCLLSFWSYVFSFDFLLIILISVSYAITCFYPWFVYYCNIKEKFLSPESPGTHFINLRMLEGQADHEVNCWF